MTISEKLNMSTLNNIDAMIDAGRIDEAEEILLSVLPHGSGIDADWTFEYLKNGTIVCRNEYHVMHDGYYVKWIPFHIKIFRHRKNI